MTTAKQPSGAPMEPLDLDSLLRSHGGDLFSSSDEDDDAASVHRRTVDELLIDSDSSDSDEAPRSTSISLSAEAVRSVPGEDQRPAIEEAAAAAEIIEERATSSFPWRSSSSELFSSSDSLSSLGFRRYSTPAVSSSSSSSSRPLLALFGGVWPSPKPGAALAAAAAASRSVPTPHAAAIKSRRAGTGSLEKAFQPPDPPADSLVEDGVGSEGSGGDGSDLSEVAPSSNGKSVVVEDVDRFAAVSRSNSSPSEAETGEIPEENDVSFSIKDTENSQLLQEREEQVDSFPVDSPPVITDENVHELEFEAELEHTQEVESEALESERDDFDEKSIDSREGEEIDMGNEIDKLVEERLGQLENSKKAEKKLRASMMPLERAEELEKRLASSGLDWEEGAAAQPMRLEGIRRGPPAVGYLQIDLDNAVTRTVSSQTFLRDYGSLQVLAVHMSFIAVGTSRGAVIVFPSKYSAHCADSMDAKMLTFGAHGERSQTPVTSMCFNQQGDLLLVGYGDGHLTVWDVQRAAALKVVYGEHTAPVVHTLFLGQDSQVTRQFKAVTGDSKGLVVLHTFSVLLVPLLNRVSIKTQCLLDGQNTGTVLSASPLLTDGGVGYASQGNSTVGTSGLGSMVGGVVGGVVGETGWKSFNEGSSLVEEGVVVFATHQNALVVRLSPNVEAYDKFSKPDGVRDGSMPYTAWKCTGYSHSSSLDASDKASWLACAWDRRVQIAKLVKSEMKKYREWNLDSTVIGVAWLDDQMLVVLTLRGQLCLFSKDGTELHRTSFVVDGLGLDDIITYHTHFTNTFGNPEKAYHNSVAVRGATIYILGPVHLIVSRLLPWKERIQVLQRAGDWMGALDMAMRLYDGHAHGVIDLPRTVDAIRETVMPFLVELLLSYVDEVFSYISIAFCNQTGKVGQPEGANSTDSSVHSEIEEQYARVGGVAVEFCVHIKRTDILFDSIFSKFVAVKHGGTFLEILEPYILKDMLGCLPPEIMQALVEHYSGKGWLQRVEQCVLHMDISSLDFNQVVKLCREHGLYGALIYLFNQGLADFKTPLEELLVVVQNSASIDTAIGYRMLVYLKYCFQGLAFPPGHGSLSHSQMPLVRKELLQFLLEDSKPFSSQVFKIFESSCRNLPNLCYLLWLDTEATLEVLRYAFPEENHENSVFSHDLTASNMEQGKEYGFDSVENQNVLVQSIANVLVSVLNLESDAIRSFKIDDGEEVWPSKKDLGQLLEYIAYLVTCKGAIISWRVFKHILEYLTSQNLSPPHQENEVSQKEKQVITILKALSQMEWDSSYVLRLCTEAQFFQACGLIHNIRGEYIAALDSYMKDLYEPVHAFAFINSMLLQLTNSQLSLFQSAVISRIPELVKLNRECTFFLVIDRFSDESQNILSKLHSHPQSLFLFLKTAIDVHLSGTLDFSMLVLASNIPYGRMSNSHSELEAYFARLKDFPKLLHHNVIQVTDEMAELYLELLCQYERNSVLKFLETFENYRLEHCLRLCQEYGVTNATAFLLERVGDVGSALELVMNGLDEKIDLLVAAIESKFSEITLSSLAEMDILPGVFKMSEVVSVHDILHASIGLCQRNTQRLDPEESKTLWFRLLDSFSEPFRRFYGGKEVPERRNIVDKLFGTSETKLHGWRFSKLHKCASVLRRLFSQFVGEIIEGMAEYLALPAIMSKLLSDNGNQEFGDFKLTILRMLGTYGYEKRILDTAKTLIEDDTFYTMGLLKKGASHAFAPRDFMCCICGSPLTKGSNSLRIRVFNCGHCTHLHCESEESEPSSRYSAVGCPICLPKKNPRAKNKSVLVDNGLVRNSISNAQHIQGFQHLHELDVDKPYGLQQMSRFDILNSLQKAQRSLEIDSLPQLRLSPPAIYHEKVQKGAGSLAGETSNTVVKNEKTTKRWQLRDLKSKGTISRFPLKSNIWHGEK